MANDEDRPILGEPRKMVAARLAASLPGALPVVGPLIQAVITEAIPNIRIQRIESFLQYLAKRIDEPTLSARLRDEESLDLFEEGIWQAARAVSEERKQRIVNLVVDGLSGGDDEIAVARHWLRLMGQFGDQDIALLLDEYAWSVTHPHDEEGARERHKQNSDLTRSRQLHLYSYGLLVRIPTADGGGFIHGVTGPGVDFLRHMGLIDQADATDGG